MQNQRKFDISLMSSKRTIVVSLCHVRLWCGLYGPHKGKPPRSVRRSILFAMPSIQHCAEKVQLLQEYQKATEAYSVAVTDLAEKIGVVPKVEYDRLKKLTEICRHRSSHALDRLDRHTADHGC